MVEAASRTSCLSIRQLGARWSKKSRTSPLQSINQTLGYCFNSFFEQSPPPPNWNYNLSGNTKGTDHFIEIWQLKETTSDC